VGYILEFGIREEELTPNFTLSVSVLMVNVLWVYGYCAGFSDYEGTIFEDVSYDLSCQIQYHVWSVWNFWLLLITDASSLVSWLFLEIPVEM
jgi:hypothetical protein